MMINSFETGGSERQFAVLAKNLDPEQFELHLGCIRRGGAFAEAFGPVPEFRLGGSLFGWQSLRTRLLLRQHLRQNHVQIAHAFDFYTNLTLIPAARLARVNSRRGQRARGVRHQLSVGGDRHRRLGGVVPEGVVEAVKALDRVGLGIPGGDLGVVGAERDVIERSGDDLKGRGVGLTAVGACNRVRSG